MTTQKPESDDMQTALKQDVDDYLAQGGEIHQVQEQEILPRHFEMTTLITMVTPRLSPWQEDELEKAEALLVKLNISGNDPLAVRGTGTSKLTTYDVWSALVWMRLDALKKHPTWGVYDQKKLKLIVVELQIYKHALLNDGRHDQSSHRILFTELLYLLLDRKSTMGWVVRKPHILENMVLVAIQHVCDPRKFRDTRDYSSHKDSRTYDDHRGRDELSSRQWAAKLGLGNHCHWKERWQARYFDFLNDLTYLDIFAAEAIERQL